MDYSIQLVENLIQEIFKYNQGIPNNEYTALILDEIESPHYMDSSYKLIRLSNHSYNDWHYSVTRNNITRYYDIFTLENDEVNEYELYQITFCNLYTKVVKFDKSNYPGAIIMTNFKNPGFVYSFYDGSIIIVESEEKVYHTYTNIKV